MSTTFKSTKEMRGTKRVCQACEVRFYDLLREPIVCPSCGAEHTPEVRPAVEARAAPFAGKTGWRSKGFKRPAPMLPEAEPERTVSPEAAATEELEVAAEEPAGTAPEDDIVLDQEADDADVSGLVDHDVGEPKER
jgi:uncharacterized protein (TIGR02300 family)